MGALGSCRCRAIAMCRDRIRGEESDLGGRGRGRGRGRSFGAEERWRWEAGLHWARLALECGSRFAQRRVVERERGEFGSGEG